MIESLVECEFADEFNFCTNEDLINVVRKNSPQDHIIRMECPFKDAMHSTLNSLDSFCSYCVMKPRPIYQIRSIMHGDIVAEFESKYLGDFSERRAKELFEQLQNVELVII